MLEASPHDPLRQIIKAQKVEAQTQTTAGFPTGLSKRVRYSHARFPQESAVEKAYKNRSPSIFIPQQDKNPRSTKRLPSNNGRP